MRKKASFWNHAQNHRLCGRNRRAGEPFDHSLSLIHKSHAPPYQQHRNHPWYPGYRAEFPFSVTSNCRTEREACSSSAQGYCRSQEFLWDLWAAGWAWPLFSGRSTDFPWYNDMGLSGRVLLFCTRPMGVVDREGRVQHFAHFHRCLWSGYGVTEMGNDQRGTYADSQLCVPLWAETDTSLCRWKWMCRTPVAYAAAS